MSARDVNLVIIALMFGAGIGGGSMAAWYETRPIKVECSVVTPPTCSTAQDEQERLLNGLDWPTISTSKDAASRGLDAPEATRLLLELAQVKASAEAAIRQYGLCEARRSAFKRELIDD